MEIYKIIQEWVERENPEDLNDVEYLVDKVFDNVLDDVIGLLDREDYPKFGIIEDEMKNDIYADDEFFRLYHEAAKRVIEDYRGRIEEDEFLSQLAVDSRRW